MLPAQCLFTIYQYLLLADSGDGGKHVVTRSNLAPFALGRSAGAKRCHCWAGISSALGWWFVVVNGAQSIIPVPGSDLRQAGVQPKGQVELLLCRDCTKTRRNTFYSCLAYPVFVFSCD